MNNKKIIFAVTRKYMMQNKKRTFTTLCGIILMVVLLTCVFVGKDTIFSYLAEIASLKNGSWHVICYEIDQTEYEKLKNLDYVQDIGISVDYKYMECAVSANDNKPFWEVKAYSKNAFAWRNLSLLEGRFPENVNEIVISKAVIDDGSKIDIGDKISGQFFARYIKGINPDVESTVFPYQGITVHYGESIEVNQDFPYYAKNESVEEIHKVTGAVGNYTIVGIMDVPDIESETSSFYSAITFADEDEMVLDTCEKINIFVKFDLDKIPANYGYIDDFEKIMGLENNNEQLIEANDMLLIFLQNSSENSMNIIVDFVMIFFVILISIISIILIFNVFNISYEERKHYLGMLSSIGATRRQRKSSVYYEAFLLLGISLPIGILLGFEVVKAGMGIINPYIHKMMGTMLGGEMVEIRAKLCVNPSNILLIIIMAVVTVFFSSYFPAKKIEKDSPIESIKGSQNTSTKVSFVKYSILALATRNVKSQKAKTKSIVRSIAVFMIIFSVTSFGATAVTKMVHYRLVEDVAFSINESNYDYVIYEENGYSDIFNTFEKEAYGNPEVDDVRLWYEDMFCCSVEEPVMSDEYWEAYRLIANEYFDEPFTKESFEAYTKDWMATFSVIAIDDETYEKIEKACGVTSPVSENGVIIYQNLELSTDKIGFENYSARNYRFFKLDNATNLEQGDKFSANIPNGKTEEVKYFPFTVDGFATDDQIKDYFTFHGEQPWIITRASTAECLNEILKKQDYNTLNRTLYIKLENKNSAMGKKLEKMSKERNLENHIIVCAATADKFGVASIAETINLIINIVAVCFVVFSSFICLLNLFNSVKGRADARKKEIGMLRSIGMEDIQIGKMLNYENAYLLIKGVLWSFIISFPMIKLMKYILTDFFGNIKMNFPLEIYVVSLIITIVLLELVSAKCYQYRKKDNILEDLKRENI